jgi:hypothetical protein
MGRGLYLCLYTRIAKGASEIGFDICGHLGYNGRCAPGGTRLTTPHAV